MLLFIANRRLLLCLVYVMLPASVLAQAPIRERDHGRGVAPQGYNRSGDYFVPTNPERSKMALPKRDGEVCPHGFTTSGSACLSTR